MSKSIDKSVKALARQIHSAIPGQSPIETGLATSDRVLRRVTDGIYREPWSALRELVSNAYDADATEVTIDTDAPRFDRIILRDNGMGFSGEALAAMIKSIGGSPKRTHAGAEIGVTDTTDFTRSPKGRKLIGKLGIGLFAVSQLTHEFQVITKREGEESRTVADVILFRYAENSAKRSEANEEEFQTGTVRIWKVPTPDRKAHGTEIVLRNLLPRTKTEFASRDLWTLVHAPPADPDEEQRHAPKYHIGCVDLKNTGELLVAPVLPWGSETDPDLRFTRFAQSMFDRADDAEVRRPSLENTFDNYFKFLWYLSLSAPLDYLHKHPFDLDSTSGLGMYRLGNRSDDTAVALHLKPGQTIRRALKLRSPERGSNATFSVSVDGVRLKRPIRFAGLPKSNHSVDRPLLFVGHDKPELSQYAEGVRGGDLEFEAYLLWNPRVVPVEHNGALVRVNDASGTMFDPTFLKYQVSEQTRLRQVSAEIYVMEGLDAALNIDRESFNVSHPHYQYVASWMHNAFKQFATRHKDIAKTVRTKRVVAQAAQAKRHLARVVADIVEDWSGGDEVPVTVEFAEEMQEGPRIAAKDRLVYSLETVFAEYDAGSRTTARKSSEYEVHQSVMRSVAQVLYAAGVFDRMGHARQQRLLGDLAKVIFHSRGS